MSSKKKKRKRSSFPASELHTCAICFEEKQTKNLAVLNNCDHRYCTECIQKWCDRENSCPQCKKKITFIDIPGRKRRKRIVDKSLQHEEDNILPEDHIISLAVMNYVASSRFRQYMAQTILRRSNMRARILWHIIQRALPPLRRQIEESIEENYRNINRASLDVLEASDAMLRLRYAIGRD